MQSKWRDNRDRFGRGTRLLHWGMALLLLWQFGGMLLKDILGRTPLTKFWVGSHGSIGVLLLLLILIRLGWYHSQRRHRPPHDGGIIGRLATIGQGLLYILLLVVPSLAFARMLGSGKDVQLFGVMLKQGTGEKIEWLMAPANLLHGTLAWVLLALIAGHVGMALIHQFVWRDGTIRRMIGRPRDISPAE